MRAWLTGLGAFAFVASIGVEIYRRTETTQLTRAQAMFKEEAEWILNGVESQLQHPDTCTKLLGGSTYRPGEPVTLDYSYNHGFPGPLKAGSEISTGLVLDVLTLEPAQDEHVLPTEAASGNDMRTQSALFPGEKLFRSPVRLHMVLTARDRMLSTQQTGPTGYTKPFYVWTNSSGVIVNCFGPRSVGAFCNSLGGFYARGAAAEGRPDQDCRPSVFTEAWVNEGWRVLGSCRYGGIVQAPELCAVRYGSHFEPQLLQATIPTGGMDAHYMCVRCQ